MKTFRIICLVISILFLGYHIFSLDYQDLRFRANKRHYLGILAMILVGMSFLLGVIKDRKNKQ